MTTPEAPLIGAAAAPALHVMSWNIRRRMSLPALRAADRWSTRAPRAQELLSTERPTLLGVQEALTDQAELVRAALGADYRLIGQGRSAEGRGEGCPIVYDAARLELLDWEQAALSDSPTRPGSTSWGNIIPRILVSAIFEDLATSRRFHAINTHLDHLSPRSRLRSAQALGEAAAASGLPAVITGDFNAPAGSAPLRALLAEGEYRDAWSAAQERRSQEWDTYANYRAPRQRRGRIDWILTGPAFRVDRAAINARQHQGGWASDHLPVQAEMTLGEGVHA